MNIQEIKNLIFTARQVQEYAVKKHNIEIPIRTIQEAMKNQPSNPYGAVLDSNFIGFGRHKVWVCTKESADIWVKQYAERKPNKQINKTSCS